MQDDRWQQIQDLFDQALALPAGEREAFLGAACGDDGALRDEVAAMLAADAAGEGFLEETVSGGAALAVEAWEPAAQPRRFGKYQILDKLGEGGYGQVYEALDPILGRQVAIKICTSENPELRERFHREARIAASLQHPNIVTVHDFGLEQDIPFLVQELLGGEDLAHVIQRRQPLALVTQLDYLLQIARGLDHAHQNGVLHRDVKPANVRVLEDGRVKILDFGIARLSSSTSRLTGEGMTIGTVGYLAPEQLWGQDPDQRSDIFAFGVLAYELLAHEHPFAADDFARISHRLLREKPPPLRQRRPACPRPLEALIMRCLAKVPTQRDSSFSEVIAALEAIAEQGATEEPIAGPVAGWRKRRWSAATALVIVVTASSLVAASYLLQRPEHIAEPPLELASAEATDIMAKEAPAGPEEERAKPDEAASETKEPLRSDTGSTAASSMQAAKTGVDPPAQPKRAAEEPTLIDKAPPPRDKAPPAIDKAPPTSEKALPASDEVSPANEKALPTSEKVSPTNDKAPPPLQPTSGPASSPRLAVDAETDIATPETAPSPPPPAVDPPELLNQPTPHYPPGARRRGREAQVVIALLVDEEGRVKSSVVKSTTDDELGFVEAAREAAAQARFRPAMREGERVQMWTEITFDFKLPSGGGS